jgi:thiopurine S-methyltransferase
VRTHYGAADEVSVLADEDLPGGLKGVCPAIEKALLLTPS